MDWLDAHPDRDVSEFAGWREVTPESRHHADQPHATNLIKMLKKEEMVDATGFEPVTFWV